jgi:hypothetical protein
LILVTGPGKDIEKRESGSLLLFAPCVPERRDFKSGGIIQPIDQEI